MRIAYWIVTVLLCFGLLGGGVMDLTQNPQITAGFDAMGYPHFLGYILGFWKVLAVIALLAPGFPRVKEWAYAGVFFLLTGAFVSHGLGEGAWSSGIGALVFLALSVVSNLLRPEDRKLAPSNT